jgi:hypothetical protein
MQAALLLLFEHIVFKSKANVKSVCTELAANLKAQGMDQGRQRFGHAGLLNTKAETGRC